MAEAAVAAAAAQYKAIVLGASGAVGSNVLKELLASPLCRTVTALVRRPLDVQHDKLQQHVVDMERLEEETAARVQGHTVAVSTVGMPQTYKATEEAFMKVDVDTPLAFARACKAGGVMHFSLLSTVGADATSIFKYTRVKGKSEHSISSVGFERVSIFKPSLLRTQTARFGISDVILQATWPALDFMMPSKFHAIKVDDLGRAFRINMETPGPKGVKELHWAEFKKLLDSQPRHAKQSSAA